MKQNKKGFTLVELLGVIAILAILMLLVTPRVIESFNKSKKSLFYENVLSIYNNTFTIYSLRMIKGDTNKRFCVGKDTTLNKLEINDIKGLYYDVTLDNNNNIIDIKVKNKNYNISLSNSKGISKGDIKEDIINENEDDEFKCNGNSSGVTLKEAILRDNPTISERTDFSVTNTENTTGIIYKTNKTEDGSDAYYYSGNTTNNWVKFGGFYWRIIRTNEEGSTRLLYSGTSHDTTEGYIGISKFNPNTEEPMYNGYMYGTSGTLSSNRQNTNDSIIKTYIDNWYKNNLLSNYDKYISKETIYCNDRSVGSGTYSTSTSPFLYGAYTRLVTNNNPSYKCGANITNGLFESIQALADKFSASTGAGGNGQLKYPIALITLDELVFAGGKTYTNLLSPYTWYYINSEGNSIIGRSDWWTMSPSNWTGGAATEWYAFGSELPGRLITINVSNSSAVRPVISLSSCAKVTGSGTPTDPYVVDENNSKC